VLTKEGPVEIDEPPAGGVQVTVNAFHLPHALVDRVEHQLGALRAYASRARCTGWPQ